MSKPVTCAPRARSCTAVAARAAAVVQHVCAPHVAQGSQVVGLGLGEDAGCVEADNQRVVVASEVFRLVPLLFEM